MNRSVRLITILCSLLAMILVVFPLCGGENAEAASKNPTKVTKLTRYSPTSKKLTIQTNQTITLKIKLFPKNLDKSARDVTFKVTKGEKSIVSIGKVKYSKKNGYIYAYVKVKAKSVGKVTLTARSKKKNKKVSWEIKVKMAPPVISTQPSSISFESIDETATLKVVAKGSGLKYQWYKSGVAIQGATLSTYQVRAADSSVSREYYCIVSNTGGKVKSNNAIVRANYITFLNNLTNIGGWLSRSDHLTDNYGNHYNYAYDNEFGWTGSSRGETNEYLLDMKYRTFYATLYVPKGVSDNGDSCISIYCDGSLVYTSPAMNKISRPVKIATNVIGCNDFEIQWSENHTYNNESPCMICLGDAYFIK